MQTPYLATIEEDPTQEDNVDEKDVPPSEEKAAEPQPASSSSTDVKLAPLITEVLGETLANIIQETVQKELVLTARSRTIALPPRSPHHVNI